MVRSRAFPAFAFLIFLTVGASAAQAQSAAETPPAAANEAPANAPAPDAPPSTAPDASSEQTPERPDYLAAEPKPAAAFAGAPPPRDASGIATPRDTSHQRWLWFPRVLLFVPRYALEVVFAPLRLGMWSYEHYEVRDRFKRIFFNETETLGVFPTVEFESGFGAGVGAVLIARNLFAAGTKLRLKASIGGRERQSYEARLGSGRLLGEHFELELRTSYRRFLGSFFYGYGNSDELAEPVDVGMDLDPIGSDIARQTRYRHNNLASGAAAIVRFSPQLKVGLHGAYRATDFDAYTGSFGDQDIEDVFDVDALPGYRTGLSNVYSELELVYDTRRATRFYLSRAAPSTGWLGSAFVGYQWGQGEDPSEFGRWGLELMRFFDLYGGDRVLVTRAYVEGVTGSLSEVPFTDLPLLGGPLLLRGYNRARFRDRLAAMMSAEYDYPISRRLSGYLFTDVGRVFRDLDDVSAENLRVGFGGGLQLHMTQSFLARLGIFSSKDGGLLFFVSFDPIFDVHLRNPLL